MADYNLVKIGTVYLTDDGTSGGNPCRTEVTGLQALKASKTGAVQAAADGTPYAFLTDNTGKGVVIGIKPFTLTKTVFDSVVTAINAALATPAAINITVSGDTGNFDLDCLPVLPLPVTFPGTFASSRIDGVEFNFIISDVNV